MFRIVIPASVKTLVARTTVLLATAAPALAGCHGLVKGWGAQMVCPRKVARLTLTPFLQILLSFLVLFHGAGTAAESAKKYPPYPDVWGYEGGSGGISYLCSAKDGDFYIFSGKYYRDLPKTKIVGLFSGSIIKLSPKEAEGVARQGKPVAGLGQLACRERYSYPNSVTLQSGYTIKGACIGGSCQHPFGLGVEVMDKTNRVVARKVFLHLLEKPRTISVSRPAAEGGAFDVVGRVLRLDPHFVSLEDDTFLFVGEDVVRFDALMNTLFPVNRDRLFMVDTTLVEEIYRKASEEAPTDEAVLNQLVQEMLATQLDRIKEEKRQ